MRVRIDHGKHAQGGIEMTCVVASEIGAPPAVKALCWRLLTKRVACTAEQVIELVE